MAYQNALTVPYEYPGKFNGYRAGPMGGVLGGSRRYSHGTLLLPWEWNTGGAWRATPEMQAANA